MGCCGSAEATACTNNDEVASPLAVSFSRGGADEDPTGLPRLLGRSASSAAASASCESLKSGQKQPATGAAAPDLGQPLGSGDGPGLASSSAVCNSAGAAWQLAKVENEEAQEALARGWECLRADEPLRAVGYFTEAIKILPTSAEAYNLRGIAKELMQTPGAHQDDQDYQADYQRADQLAGDPETKKRLEMLRKWKPVGWQVRREVEAKTLASALVIKEREFGTEHAEVALTLNNLAGACGDLGDHQQKKRLLERALGIFAATVGPDHPHTQAVLENLIRSHADELASEIWAALGMASG
ncbi:Klc4 [Symbiodinium sp. CCMP2456]|nr:Klc4 [Symbiodinium sp. CCMP2456]